MIMRNIDGYETFTSNELVTASVQETRGQIDRLQTLSLVMTK